MIALTGRVWLDDKAQKPRYCLLLNAEQAEVNDELISLLPQQMQKIVAELQPEGR